MKKLFLVLVSVLLLTGVAQAVDMDQSITNELSAHGKGRSVTSDNSVLFTVWYTGSGANPSAGVSNSTALILTSNGAGTQINTTDTAYDTVAEIVSYINASVTDWKASVGPDGYDAQSTALLLPLDQTATANNETDGTGIELDQSTATYMLCGVKKKAGYLPRLKSIETMLSSTNGNMTITVYDGDTAVWSKWISDAVYKSATAVQASPSSVALTPWSEKGLSATKGNELVVKIDTDGSFNTDSTAKNGNRIAIVYDQLAQ